MPDSVPPTESVTASEAGGRWAELLDRVARGEARLVVERDGTPAAALISAADFARFRQYGAARAQQYKALRSRAHAERAAAFTGIPDEDLDQEAADAIAEARTDDRPRQRRAVPSRDRR
ncbi:MAG: type II toxin-antitoxin system Phd/YefM family antitoxin [Dehalococcoidia bacterium]